MPLFSIDPDMLRVRVGLAAGDVSKDTEIDAAIVVAVELIETFLDRKLEFATEVESFNFSGASLSLLRYPIDSIASIAGDGLNEPDYSLDKKNGLIFFTDHIGQKELTVTYDGGYNVLPKPLEMAVISVFDNVYGAVFDQDYDAGNDEIKTVKAGDLAITYERGTGYAGHTGNEATSRFLTADLIGMLQHYRRQSV